MIPYDDLVIALQTWRAKQGLPVAQMSGSLTPPPMQAQAPAVAAPRTQPPAAPGSGRTTAVAPPPLEPPPTHDDSLDVDGALIEEAHYENEGDDFAMAFSGATEHGESTAIGRSPADHTLDEGGTEVASPAGRVAPNPGRNEDW